MRYILLVDSDKTLQGMLSHHLLTKGFLIDHVDTMDGVRNVKDLGKYDLVLLNDKILGDARMELIQEAKRVPGGPDIILIASHGDLIETEFAIRSGALDYIRKSDPVDAISASIYGALQHRDGRRSTHHSSAILRDSIIGNSPAIQTCLAQVYKAAQSDISVLITGETGTGKEIFSWCIHNNSHRSKDPFVVVDCAALPETLVESILFGHIKGSFTGAERDRSGLIRQAHGGTLFLDEVGELPLTLQRSFLRALQEHKFRPIGSDKEEESDFRLIAATNRNLDQMANAGSFRSDLLYRIRSLVIELPPLRDRGEDLVSLTRYYLDCLAERLGKNPKKVSSGFLSALQTYSWPGNIRELFTCLECAASNGEDQEVLQLFHLPPTMKAALSRQSLSERMTHGYGGTSKVQIQEGRFLMLEEVRNRSDKDYLVNLVKHSQGDIRLACSVSGLSRSSLYALLRRHQVSLR